jgi:hypothetical protein
LFAEVNHLSTYQKGDVALGTQHHIDEANSQEPIQLLSAEVLFAGGGELGWLMRQFDWSQTSLGPVEFWPQSLRTCVRIVLNSRQPMFVWWGDDLICSSRSLQPSRVLEQGSVSG